MQAGDGGRGGEWEGAVSEPHVQTGVCTPTPWSWGVYAGLPASGGGVAGGDIPENMYATTWASIGSFKASSLGLPRFTADPWGQTPAQVLRGGDFSAGCRLRGGGRVAAPKVME